MSWIISWKETSAAEHQENSFHDVQQTEPAGMVISIMTRSRRSGLTQTLDDRLGWWQQMFWFDALHSDGRASASPPGGGGFNHKHVTVSVHSINKTALVSGACIQVLG